MKKDIKILVAMHKKYWVAKDPVYLPIFVGKCGRQSDWQCIGDDTGDNISAKNPNFCELTGLYWAWKNLDCEYIGLVHYRRYFIKRFLGLKLHINRYHDFAEAMDRADVLLPTPLTLSKTVFDQYAERHHVKDIIECGKIINEKYPEYINDFNAIMNGSKGWFFNMFCMKKTLCNRYCSWLFDILFELEKRIDISDYDMYQRRVFGFLSERLFTVWLHHENLKVTSQEVYGVERAWLRRKLLW
ncbi:DUF4422 domain-containing protein [Selenomonas bovis]|uniref:DUF4422 domain-containing protein n=1 Tax=Selenomonas bovis TaxID=416586 RepID=UPI0003A8385F|nr:DUF4422 domain-containing protein [Selenomonas bovis]